MLRLKRILCLLWALRPWGNLKDKASFIVKTHGIDVELQGYGLPEEDETSILVSNHLGYLDPIILASLVKCRPIAKASLTNWPGIGYALKRMGLLFYERGSIISGFKINHAYRATRLPMVPGANGDLPT